MQPSKTHRGCSSKSKSTWCTKMSRGSNLNNRSSTSRPIRKTERSGSFLKSSMMTWRIRSRRWWWRGMRRHIRCESCLDCESTTSRRILSKLKMIGSAKCSDSRVGSSWTGKLQLIKRAWWVWVHAGTTVFTASLQGGSPKWLVERALKPRLRRSSAQVRKSI